MLRSLMPVLSITIYIYYIILYYIIYSIILYNAIYYYIYSLYCNTYIYICIYTCTGWMIISFTIHAGVFIGFTILTAFDVSFKSNKLPPYSILSVLTNNPSTPIIIYIYHI
jgi:hypothetical protein